MSKEIIYPLCSFFCSLLVTRFSMPWLLNFCKKRGLYDIPNERKVHSNKIPRMGGVLFAPAMMIGICCALGVMSLISSNPLPTFKISTFVILVGIFLIYCIGLLDDILGLNARIKFAIQFAASIFMPLCGLYFNNLYGFMGIYEIPIWVGYPLTIFISLLIVNSINLIDGIDGLASGLSLIALTAFLIIFYQLHVITYTIFTAGLLGSLTIFLYYNMFGSTEKNTKTFMGDTGSLILGYALAFLAIKHAMYNPHVLPYRENSLLVSFTLLIIPTFDLIRVALMRIRHGKSIFHADKTHIHHKLMAAGFSMRSSLLIILGMQIGFILINFALYAFGLSSAWIVLLDIIFFIFVMLVIEMKKKNE